ncbi:hypothetical protein GMLC_29680 [Geomonas limicola]|uniref:Fibronectin type-III domain-containing protein n=1 Tax=Geomonas limicola TaxID=2740186 RepID=A0A6V8NE42_9BACT|nr:MXAN_2562 family outer membrane beta-barrel protein [Geomonas limicola]GFO69389.1 hypothetical protein GMLC_29680 [Geomonas limicola]
MNVKCSAVISVVLLLLFTLTTTAHAVTTTMTVQHTGSGTNIFNTIQAAIEAVHNLRVGGSTDTFEIKVLASSTAYAGPITMKDPISIYGERTGGTFISGGNPQITVSGIASGAEIRNFTFLSTGTAIAISGSSAVRITNNVFTTGTGNTAITVSSSPSSSIINNTFYKNNIAISTDTNLVITNNIFASNNKAIATSAATSNITYNDYNPSGITFTGVTLDLNSIPNTSHTNSDPKFVDPDNATVANKDFHLQSGSPCIGTGNTLYVNPGSSVSDMGAYGGPKADLTVPTVTGLTASVPQATPSTVVLSWNASTGSQVTAYRVYYGPSSGNYAGFTNATPATGSTVTSTTASIQNLPLDIPATPAAPVLAPLEVISSTVLKASWGAVAGATGYLVYYSTSAFTDTTLPATFLTVNGGSVTSVLIPNLSTGQAYFVSVIAVTQTTVFAAVTAVVDTNLAANFGVASSNESAYSTEVSQGIGQVVQSSMSNQRSDFPEATSPAPSLKSEGCFIATAAFGFYSAPQVQALRDFRDRYLMTNAPGRAFVAWYYHYGPYVAHFINVHPWLKVPVRAVLFPLIVMSLVLTGGSFLAKSSLILLATLLFTLRRRNKITPLACKTARLLPLLLLLLLPGLAQGAAERPDRPHWSFELKGGAFFPAKANSYGDGAIGQYGGTLAYKLHRMVEVGVGATYLSATGKGQLVAHQTPSSQRVDYELLPLDVFIVGRAVFSEDQLLVPYIGGGYTRLFYRERVSGGETVKGSVNGFHARGGVQVLMDGLERDASQSLYKEFGIHHTYLFVEGNYLNARADTTDGGSVNAGGTSVLGGLLFEF